MTDTARSGKEQLYRLFAGWGLARSLADWAWSEIVAGRDPEEVLFLAQERDEWKQRFYGNELREQLGLAPLAPAEYLSYERTIGERYAAYGIPRPSRAHVAALLAGDRSAREVDEDLAAYQELRDNPYVRQQFYAYTGVQADDDDLFALALGYAPDLEQRYTQAVTNLDTGQVAGRLKTSPVMMRVLGQNLAPDASDDDLVREFMGTAPNRGERLRALRLAELANKGQWQAGGGIAYERPRRGETF